MIIVSAAIKKALVRLLVATMISAGLIYACFHVDHDLVGIVGGVLILLALPAVVLLSVDASRVIRREVPSNRSVKILGLVLAIPQAVMGVILIAFGIIYPLIGISEILADLAQGRSAVIPFVTTVTALVMLGLGYFYLREGLGLGKKNDGH
ncbi:MAG TPA: hypothetical protein VEI74_12760 [Candidatus Methylomirabilis sp.]|nr:hypothetical protein [Candidatus Methylomirabilis sp.]